MLRSVSQFSSVGLVSFVHVSLWRGSWRRQKQHVFPIRVFFSSQPYKDSSHSIRFNTFFNSPKRMLTKRYPFPEWKELEEEYIKNLMIISWYRISFPLLLCAKRVNHMKDSKSKKTPSWQLICPPPPTFQGTLTEGKGSVQLTSSLRYVVL